MSDNFESNVPGIAIGIPKIDYLKKWEVWKKDVKQEDRIDFINPKDFHLSELLAGIGID